LGPGVRFSGGYRRHPHRYDGWCHRCNGEVNCVDDGRRRCGDGEEEGGAREGAVVRRRGEKEGREGERERGGGGRERGARVWVIWER